MIPLIWVGGLALGALSAWQGKKHLDKRKYTPERRMVFETAMEKVKDAQKLNGLADQYEAVGLKPQAILLRKRAQLRALPDSVKQARRATMAKALQSKDVPKLLQFADALDSETAYANAAKIRAYVKTLQNGVPSGADMGV